MYTPNTIVDQVIDALAAFVALFGGGAPIVRGQGNRVPLPPSPCVVLTELISVDLSTPRVSYDDVAQTADITGPTRIDVQIDFYGDTSADYCRAVKQAFWSQWAFDQFPSTIKPLYASDGMQSPLTTAEQQYESRWTLTASLQYNPVVTVPQQSANVLAVHEVIAADV